MPITKPLKPRAVLPSNDPNFESNQIAVYNDIRVMVDGLSDMAEDIDVFVDDFGTISQAATTASQQATQAALSADAAQESATQAENIVNNYANNNFLSLNAIKNADIYTINAPVLVGLDLSGRFIEVTFNDTCTDNAKIKINDDPAILISYLDKWGNLTNTAIGDIYGGYKTLGYVTPNEQNFVLLSGSAYDRNKRILISSSQDVLVVQDMPESEIQLATQGITATIPPASNFFNEQYFWLFATQNANITCTDLIFENGIGVNTLALSAGDYIKLTVVDGVAYRVTGKRGFVAPDFTSAALDFPLANTALVVSVTDRTGASFIPREYKTYIVFKTASNGFAVGNKIEIGNYHNSTSSSHTVFLEGNQIRALFGQQGINMRGQSANQVVPAANLSLIFEAWK